MSLNNTAEVQTGTAEQAQNLDAINAEIRDIDSKRNALLAARKQLVKANKKPLSRIGKIATGLAATGALAMVGLGVYRLLTKTVSTVAEGA